MTKYNVHQCIRTMGKHFCFDACLFGIFQREKAVDFTNQNFQEMEY